MTSLSEPQKQDVVALVTWIQQSCFPLIDSDNTLIAGSEGPVAVVSVLDQLDDRGTARDILKVAEDILDTPSENIDSSSTEQIWMSLLHLSSAKARPVKGEEATPPKKLSRSNLKLQVLSNLLDCAVQNPNLPKRRVYIERIMTLSKSVQKTLMGLIERRRGGNKSTPNSSRRKQQQQRHSVSPPKSALKNSNKAKQPDTSSPTPTTPPRSSHTIAQTEEEPSSLQLVPSTTPTSSTASASTQVRSNVTSQRSRPQQNPDDHQQQPPSLSVSSGRNGRLLRQPQLRTPSSSSRQHTPNSNYQQQQMTPSQPYSTSDLLSPAVMESPAQLSALVVDLERRNAQLSAQLQEQQQQQAALSQQLEQQQAEHKKQMMQLEAEAMDRQQDLQQQHEATVADLQRALEVTTKERDEHAAASKELQEARDEMDVLVHNRSVLQETTEKLRRYKTKVAELQDVKEALQREQEAHASRTEEVVQLESQLSVLQPLKRQLDEYKIRAIEAEVKLVESQDYLRRLEQQVSEAGHEAAQDLIKNGAVVLQQDQLEELQRRIQQDTQAAMEESNAASTGVGEGVSELNPELQQELVRLRNENLQLRAFAAKRQADGVQKLEESLDDAQRLSEQFKKEYLATKERLADTQASLEKSEEREKSLEADVQEWKEKSEEADRHVTELKQELSERQNEVQELQLALSEMNQTNQDLQEMVQVWTTKSRDLETRSAGYLEDLHKVQNLLAETQSELTQAQGTIQELDESLESLQLQVQQHEQVEQATQAELQQAQDALTEVRIELGQSQSKVTDLQGQVVKLKKERTNLKDEIEEERQSKHELMEESHRSIEATRAVLTTKAKKDLEELQTNMNRLLDDERRAKRQQAEEATQQYNSLDSKWKKEYEELQERSTSSIKNSREEAQDRISLMQEEHKAELEQVRKAGDEKQNDIIRKGRTMMMDLKATCKDEMQQLHDRLTTAQGERDDAIKDKEDMEHLLRSKISVYKQKLDFSVNQVNDLTRDVDEHQDKIKSLEREKYKLQEDNDRYRRQLGGRYGSDGKYQAQLESLQKEFNTLLEENRQLKRQSRYDGSVNVLGAITEHGFSEEGESQGYSSGGVSQSTLTQLRQEYEEQLEAMNDEKRELIMKNAAASTDVQKAEQRAWEKEQESAKLKGEITSLKLALQRSEFEHERSIDLGKTIDSSATDRSTKELSFFSAHDSDERSPAVSFVEPPKSPLNSPSRIPSLHQTRRSPGFRSSPSMRSSPGIDRAMKQKAEREQALRNQLSSFTGGSPSRPSFIPPPSPSRVMNTSASSAFSDNVLTPTKKHKLDPNNITTTSAEDSGAARRAADVFGLRAAGKVSNSPFKQQQPQKRTRTPPLPEQPAPPKTFMEYTDPNHSVNSAEGAQECKQS